jgi:hypothetical protein
LGSLPVDFLHIYVYLSDAHVREVHTRQVL